MKSACQVPQMYMCVCVCVLTFTASSIESAHTDKSLKMGIHIGRQYLRRAGGRPGVFSLSQRVFDPAV